MDLLEEGENGRLPYFKHHAFATGLNQLSGVQMDGLVLDVDSFCHNNTKYISVIMTLCQDAVFVEIELVYFWV